MSEPLTDVDDPDWARRWVGGPTDNSGRDEARRDHDRVFYSSEFERLEDVTQIATLTSSVVRNRLTHSYRVEQIASSIASRRPELVNEDVVMTSALVHDIGHAPFGHTGEEALQKAVTCELHRHRLFTTFEQRRADVVNVLGAPGERGLKCRGPRPCLLPDGFEGNAQSFRILTLLGSNHNRSKTFGLNLTRRVLEASLKYPWMRGENPKKPGKWGVYDGDAAAFSWTLCADPFDASKVIGVQPKSLEASIMDIADDIAYALHDLEDAYKAGLVPFSELSLKPPTPTMLKVLAYIRGETQPASTEDEPAEPAEAAPLATSSVRSIIDEYDRLTEAELSINDEVDGVPVFPLLLELQSVLDEIPRSRYSGSRSARQELSLWRGNLIARFVNDVSLEGGDAHFATPEVDASIEFLKQLTWYFVIDHPDLSAIRAGQEELILHSFDSLFAQAAEAWLVEPSKETSAWHAIAAHRKIKRLPERLVDYVELGKHQIDNAAQAFYTPRQVIARAVVDYICSLTDSEVYSYSMQLGGSPAHSVPRAFS